MDEEDPNVTQQHATTGNVGHQTRTDMNQIMPIDRRCQADEADSHDAPRFAYGGQDGVQRLSPGYQGGSRISQVHDYDERDDERGAPRPELSPALHHLWHAQPRPLRGVQCHENSANEVPDDDGN